MSVVRSSEVPPLGGSKCPSSMAKSIGGVRFVRCTEVVRFLESPLIEIYCIYNMHIRYIQYILHIRYIMHI